jgi:hypothetical protein
MKLFRSWALVGCAALALVCAVAGSAYAYNHYMSRHLARELQDRVGERISVVDKVVKEWTLQESHGYLRFDTERFRCAIPSSDFNSIAVPRDVIERRRRGDRTLPLVHMFGVVSREPIFGRVAGGKEDGVASEQILILCDRVEKPRGRFFDEDMGY